MFSVVTDTKDEIIIKAVNFAGDVDPVSITLDCQVQSDYTVTLLSGEKGDENSFEEPEKVKNITVNMHGASSEFVYEAPAYSVSVLRLKKLRSVLEVIAIILCIWHRKYIYFSAAFLPGWESAAENFFAKKELP